MNWRNATFGGAGGLVITGLLAFGMTKDPGEIPSPLPGQPAPAFVLQTLERTGSVDLASLRGRVVVLNFWASWCLNCRAEHGPLSESASAYKGKGVQFFGIIYNDSPENAERWIESMGGQTYPSLIDPGARAAIDYGVYGVPETFFISKDGLVAYKHIGPVNAKLLTTWIEKLIAGTV